MELLFIYSKENDEIYNFGGKYLLSQNDETFLVVENKKYVQDFFSSGKSKLSNVTVIVGANGTGKTTLLNTIHRTAFNRENHEVPDLTTIDSINQSKNKYIVGYLDDEVVKVAVNGIKKKIISSVDSSNFIMIDVKDNKIKRSCIALKYESLHPGAKTYTNGTNQPKVRTKVYHATPQFRSSKSDNDTPINMPIIEHIKFLSTPENHKLFEFSYPQSVLFEVSSRGMIEFTNTGEDEDDLRVIFKKYMVKLMKKIEKHNDIDRDYSLKIFLNFSLTVFKERQSHKMFTNDTLGKIALIIETENDIYDRILDIYEHDLEFSSKRVAAVKSLLTVYKNVSIVDRGFRFPIEPYTSAVNFHSTKMSNEEFNHTYRNAYKFLLMYQKAFPNYSYLEISIEGLSSGEYSYIDFFSGFYKCSELIRYDEDYDKCQTIIITIDEGDVFFHPKWQVSFIETIIDQLSIIFAGFKVQVILTTNRPLLLSDIPKNNIIYLSKDNDFDRSNVHESFGQNIHTLMTDSFFMGDSLMGTFAKKKILEVYRYLVKESIDQEVEKHFKQEDIKRIIDQVAEPILKDKLLKAYSDKYGVVNLQKLSDIEDAISKMDDAERKDDLQTKLNAIIASLKSEGILHD